MELNRKLKMGMVGGGRGAFIGAVHRMAANLDGKIELVGPGFDEIPDKGAMDLGIVVQVAGRDAAGFVFVTGLSLRDIIVTKGSFYMKAEYEISRGGVDAHAGHTH